MKDKLLAISLLATCSSFLPIKAVRADLLVYYPFDIEGGTIVGNAGTGADGALVGSATYGPGQSAAFGKAFYGNRAGADDGHVTTGLTGDELGFGAGGIYTAMAWINWAGGLGNGDHMVFGQLDGDGNNAQLHHGIRDDSAPLNVHFGGWGGAQDMSDAGAVAPDTWTHVAWQYDGTDKVVYVNGVESARAAGNNITAPALEVIIGGHGRDASPVLSFNGAIDEVKIFDEALTAEEIMSAMVALMPIEDSDGDGLGNVEEVEDYMTDPNDADSDDDGLEDGVEVANGLDPNSADGDDGADGDPDGDDLTNKNEIEVHGTDPQSDDSDGDGLKDGAEIETHETDPNKLDTDGDTLTDGEEVNEHLTNPNLIDSDGDRFNDDIEIAEGSDPNDINSIPALQPLPEPLLYYSFDVEDGTVVENLGSLATAGTLQGGATYGDSLDPTYGTAFVGNRDSANDAFVATGFAGDDLGFGATGIYTAMAWVNWAGGSGNGDHMVFGQDDGAGNNAQLHHGIRDDSAPRNVHFGGWGGAQDISDAGAVPLETWTHVAWQYDGTDKVVYVNGVESARAAGNNITNPAFDIIVGGHGRDSNLDPAPGNSFNGLLDEVKIFGEALTEDQVRTAMLPGERSGAAGLEIRTINNDRENDNVTLTFTSKPGRSYSLFWTADFQDGPDYLEIDDGIDADPVENITTYSFPAPRPDADPGGDPAPKAFFIIKQN